MIYRNTLMLLGLAIVLAGCAASNHYAQDTMQQHYDKDYSLFCAADDPKCFGNTPASDKIHHPYNFLIGFPAFPGNKAYYQDFYAEGSAEIERVDGFNSFWLRPYDGFESRIIRFSSHYQQPTGLDGPQFNAVLLGTKPLGTDTPKLHKKATINFSKFLLNRNVRYRCFGITNNKQIECYILINENLDLGEWMIKNGLVSSYGSIPQRYKEAEEYAITHEIGFNAPTHIRLSKIYPEFRKDRYGVCHSVHDLPLNDIDSFYSAYPTLDDCLQSGGIFEQRTGSAYPE